MIDVQTRNQLPNYKIILRLLSIKGAILVQVGLYLS